MSGLDPFTWAIILMLIGCALVVLEVFVPSGGILGMLSGIAILGSIIFAFRRDLTAGLTFVLISLVAVPTLLALAFRVWPHTPMGKAFLGELPNEEELKPVDTRRQLVGRLGVAKTMMLPSGSVLVDGHWLDAVSQGDAIEPGMPIVVVEVRANRVVVRQADPDEAEQITSSSPDMLSKPLNELGLEGFEDEPLG
ncbi:MAG: NfeD family protein [Bythopirellula sp.]|nr:NfeD family protein [Bythopirellula sp.]